MGGHHFRSKSDSEVALHLFEELGPRCLDQLRGEFAFMIWDRRGGRLFATRDRFGIKPLFYTETSKWFVAASEVRALFALDISRDWDPEMVYQNLFLCLNEDRTLFKNIYQVPPGHYLVASSRSSRLIKYWDLNYPRR